MISIDELIEIWVRAHKEALSAREKMASDDDLSWWRDACRFLRPTDESSVNDAPGSSS
jgi:hypothetical protein